LESAEHELSGSKKSKKKFQIPEKLQLAGKRVHFSVFLAPNIFGIFGDFALDYFATPRG